MNNFCLADSLSELKWQAPRESSLTLKEGSAKIAFNALSNLDIHRGFHYRNFTLMTIGVPECKTSIDIYSGESACKASAIGTGLSPLKGFPPYIIFVVFRIGQPSVRDI